MLMPLYALSYSSRLSPRTGAPSPSNRGVQNVPFILFGRSVYNMTTCVTHLIPEIEYDVC